MASFCSGGLSSPKSGVVGQVTATVEAVAATLALAGLELPAGVVALIGAGINFYAPTFCANDPPPDPHPTQQDLADALNWGVPSVNLPAIFKYQQWFLSHYWYDICQCTNGATPVSPVLSPPGQSTDSPRLPTGPNQPCFQNSYSDSFPVQASGVRTHDLTGQLLPTSGSPILVQMPLNGNVVDNQPAWPISPTVTEFSAVGTRHQQDTSMNVGSQLATTFLTYSAAGAFLGSLLLLQNGSQETNTTVVRKGAASVWPAAATHYAITSVTAASALGPNIALQSDTIDVVGTCSGGPLEQACCPPDPSIDARLNQIISYLQFLMGQHPTTSTSWTDGIRHTGLTLSGRVQLAAGVTGVRVEVTQVPPTSAIITGDPTFYWEMGFITPIAVDIPLRGQRLVFNPEIFSLPPQTTGVAWSLPQLCTINLVELIPA